MIRAPVAFQVTKKKSFFFKVWFNDVINFFFVLIFHTGLTMHMLAKHNKFTSAALEHTD